MTADLQTRSKQTVGKRVAANTGFLVAAKFLVVALGIGTLLIATRALSLEAFGVVIFLHAYMLFFAEVATFQNWQAIIRYGAHDQKNNDSEGLASLIKFGVKLDAISAVMAYLGSLLLFSLVVLIIEIFPALGPEGGTAVKDLQKYAAVYCLAVLGRQTSTSQGVLRLFDRFGQLASLYLVMPVIRFLGSSYAFYAGWGLEGFLAVWFFASLISYLALIAAAAWELHRRMLLTRVVKIKSSFRNQREGLWGFVIKSNIDSTLAAGTLHLPALLVMAFFGPVFTGIYRIAEEVAKLLSEGFKLLDQVIYPELAKMVVNGESEKIWKLVIRAGATLLGVGLVMSAFVWFQGPLVLTTIFSKDYAQSAPLASLLVPAAALTGLIAPLYPIFYAADKPERAIIARGLTLTAYILFFVILSSTIGKMGPAWAAIVGNLFGMLLVFLMAKNTLNKTVQLSAQSSNLTNPTNTDKNLKTNNLAIFDLDYTLTKRGTWSRFIAFTIKKRPHLWLPILLTMATNQWLFKKGEAPRCGVKKAMMSLAIVGWPKEKLHRYADEFAKNEIAKGLRPGAIEALEKHRKAGDTLIIASAAVDVIVSSIAQQLEIQHYIATDMSYENGRLAPDFATNNCYGPEKLVRVKQYIAEHKLSLNVNSTITMYSDSISDLDILLWANEGVAVDPCKRLKNAAGRHGLKIVSWI